MSWKNTQQRYGTLSIALHWCMFILIVAVYASIELRGLFPKGSDPREALKALHFMLGLSILVLITVRLYAKITAETPAISPALSPLQRITAASGHYLLYGFMIVMPLLGWLTLSAAAKPIPFFGLSLPALMAEDKVIAKTLKEIHETIGVIGYYLIAGHVIAALYHHYVRKDNTLARMLPFNKDYPHN